METNPNDKKEPEEHDSVDMLEESQQDIEKSSDMIQKLKEAENTDISKTGQEANADFFKGFEHFTQNIGSLGPENMQVSEEELSNASQMFKDMINRNQNSSKQSQPQNSDKEVKIDAEDKSDISNQLLKGYENL